MGIASPLGILMLTVMLLVGALTGRAGAQDMPVIKLVAGNAYHPYTDETLPEGGLASAIVRRTFEELGYRAEITFLPWDEGYAQTRDGHFIATFPYILTEERKQDFLYTTALFQVRPTIFWNTRRAMRIASISDLAGKTLCVPEGWAVDGYLMPLAGSGQVSVARGASMLDCFKQLHQGDVDIVSADRRLGRAMAARVASDRWSKNRRFGDTGTPNHLIFTKRHPQAAQWVKAFDTAFAKLTENGVIYNVIKEYYERD